MNIFYKDMANIFNVAAARTDSSFFSKCFIIEKQRKNARTNHRLNQSNNFIGFYSLKIKKRKLFLTAERRLIHIGNLLNSVRSRNCSRNKGGWHNVYIENIIKNNDWRGILRTEKKTY